MNAEDLNPSASDVRVTEKGNTVNATVNISIANAKGEAVSNVTTDEADTFTITYKISYKKYSKTLTRTVKVVGSGDSNKE